MSQREFTEEELRALEAEMERITVDDILLQTVVSLLNVGARKAGLGAPPGEDVKRDFEQLRQAIEAVRALLPVLEARHADKLAPVRDTLSRLQLVYAQNAAPPPAQAGAGAPPQQPAEPASKPGEPGPAQRSGRLWVPGQ